VRARPPPVARAPAGLDAAGAAGQVEQQRLVERRVRHEAARPAGHDPERDPGPARGLDACHGQRERVAEAPDEHAVEKQILDARPLEVAGVEARPDEVGAGRELLGRRVRADRGERGGERVERCRGAGCRRAELGREREGEAGDSE
jgi:hypothetical protein